MDQSIVNEKFDAVQNELDIIRTFLNDSSDRLDSLEAAVTNARGLLSQVATPVDAHIDTNPPDESLVAPSTDDDADYADYDDADPDDTAAPAGDSHFLS